MTDFDIGFLCGVAFLVTVAVFVKVLEVSSDAYNLLANELEKRRRQSK